MSTTTPLADRLDALLPQTQCTRCGYPTCRAYAQAISDGEADIDRCPPGGADGIAALAALLDRPAKPLNPDYGVEQPPQVAVIDEAVCIGCTKCIRACPVDCITLSPIAERPLSRGDVLARAVHAHRRFEARKTRLAAPGSRAPVRAEQVRETFEAEDTDAACVAQAPSTGVRPANAPAATNQAPAAPISRSAVLEAIARGRAKITKAPPA